MVNIMQQFSTQDKELKAYSWKHIFQAEASHIPIS
jgi:hypothetical protein